MTTITFPIAPQAFWFLTTLAGFLLLSLLIYVILPKHAYQSGSKTQTLQEALGLEAVPAYLFIAATIVWFSLFCFLFSGLLTLLYSMFTAQHPFPWNFVQRWDNGFLIAQVTGTAAVLGAIIALPVTLTRLRLSKEQTDTAQAVLVNEKITQIASELHARKQMSKKVGKQWENCWEDDVVRRNIAISRLEDLVQDEPSEARRVSRLLSRYVRDLTETFKPKWCPNSDDLDELRMCFGSILPARSDMENAVQVLGRLQTKENGEFDPSVEIDLRGANLQGMNLMELSFIGANLNGAHLQGAFLSCAKLHRANLRIAELDCAIMHRTELHDAVLGEAHLKCTNLENAEFHRAKLQRARLQGAKLVGTKFIGADLYDVRLENIGEILQPTFFCASVRSVIFPEISELTECLIDAFGDGTAKLPSETQRPSHWPTKILNDEDFKAKWRAFAASKGVDIPD